MSGKIKTKRRECRASGNTAWSTAATASDSSSSIETTDYLEPSGHPGPDIEDVDLTMYYTKFEVSIDMNMMWEFENSKEPKKFSFRGKGDKETWFELCLAMQPYGNVTASVQTTSQLDIRVPRLRYSLLDLTNKKTSPGCSAHKLSISKDVFSQVLKREVKSEGVVLCPKRDLTVLIERTACSSCSSCSPMQKRTILLRLQMKYEKVKPRPPLSSFFLELFKSRDHADVTFFVDGQEIKAHKCILSARSTYFRRMFSSGMIEDKTNEIRVEDCEPAVFREMLKFIYCDEPPERLDKYAQLLIPLADRYLLPELKKLCANFICSNLTVTTVSHWLGLAKSFNVTSLLEACFGLLVNEMTEEERWRVLLHNDVGTEFLDFTSLKDFDFKE